MEPERGSSHGSVYSILALLAGSVNGKARVDGQIQKHEVLLDRC